MSSLPVPLSPVMSTELSLGAMTRTKSTTSRMRALGPTTTLAGVNGSRVMRRAGVVLAVAASRSADESSENVVVRDIDRASDDDQFAELRHFILDRSLDAEVQRQM